VPEREENCLASSPEERLEKILSRLDQVEQRLLVLEGHVAGPQSGEALPAAPTSPQPPATVLAAHRTGILAGWWRRMREAEILVYPVLAAGGLNLLLEDIPAGWPATLVASLMFFGGALILAPALTRRRAAQPPASS
jgi:hypothetical protein